MIFVDTGAWIALTDSSDQYHFSARRIYAILKRQHATFLTTDYVIDETITRLRYDADHSTALRCLELLFRAEEGGVLHKLCCVSTTSYSTGIFIRSTLLNDGARIVYSMIGRNEQATIRAIETL